jgi:hypothetical protein
MIEFQQWSQMPLKEEIIPTNTLNRSLRLPNHSNTTEGVDLLSNRSLVLYGAIMLDNSMAGATPLFSTGSK